MSQLDGLKSADALDRAIDLVPARTSAKLAAEQAEQSVRDALTVEVPE